MSAGVGQHTFREPRPFVGLVKPVPAILIVLLGTFGHATPAVLFVLFLLAAACGSRR